MACFHPKKGFPVGMTKNAKVKLRITPFEIAGIDSHGIPVGEFGIDELSITSYYEIPCGKCIGCRSDQAREWSNRLIMEMSYHDSAYFVTITYDEEHMKRVTYVDEMTGEIKNDRGTLDKRDFQLFIKRLRKARPEDRIRFYLCGEYGPTTDRPHGHCILFGLHLKEWQLIPCGKSETGQQYYTCSELERIWGNGFVSIEPANEFTCKYVCQYVTKKIGQKPDEQYQAKGQVPPFALQSRRPGLGRQYYDEYGEELLQTDAKFMSTTNGSVRLTPPRYFRKLYREEQPEKAEKIAEKHLIAMADQEDAMSDLTDLRKQSILKNKENLTLKKTKLRNAF